MNPKRSAAEIGDHVPNFSLESSDGRTIGLDNLVGRPLVLFFYLQDRAERCTTEICAFRDLHPQFAALGANVVGVGVDSVESHKALADKHAVPFPLLSDPTGKACAAYGVLAQRAQPTPADGGPPNVDVMIGRKTFLISPTLRIVKTYERIDPPAHAAEVLNDLRAIPEIADPAHPNSPHAPVLIVPDVFPRTLCEQLIQLWETDGNEESGFMKEIDGKTVARVDYGHKIRRDHYLHDGEIQESVKRYVGNRILPEISKAFNFQVTRREDFRIACYEASRGGYFRPHRDNTTSGTAHRRFAMSLLLNDEYEGGSLRFPEYGARRYRPPAGGAVVFSCSLLHEATDVTAGRRFVLLSFFYGDAEARQREAYSQRTGGAYRA